MISIKINNIEYNYEPGITIERVMNDHPEIGDAILCMINKEIHGLGHRLYSDSTVELIDTSSPYGHRAYEKTALMIFIKAVHDLYPSLPLENINVCFTIGNGLYIEIKDVDINPESVLKIKGRMLQLVNSELPIVQREMLTEQAVKCFDILGMKDKTELLSYRRTSLITVYFLDDICEYIYDFVAPNTKYIREFNLESYENGIVLVTPVVNSPNTISAFECSKKIFKALYNYYDIMRASGLKNVSEFNRSISADGFNSPVLLQEAFMEKNISEIARRISSDSKIKIVLIAGPSSSGKTTFSHRLAVQLAACGIKSYPIETDNYFVDRDRVPVDAEGKPDFESLDCMDIELFDKDFHRLLNGETVRMPTYNFKTGKREYRGNSLSLEGNEILMAEGIHCLDPAMVGNLPSESIFKIFISPLSQLNIDNHNYISSNDARLIRRIIRDHRTRFYSASNTILQWPSVRRGEEKYIIPFRDEADVVFNSSMVYEISVLKPYAEALLFAIERDNPAYTEAKRLLKLLDYFLSIPVNHVPENSLLSEFVGGNIFGV